MGAHGIEFGPHTRTHPILSRIGDAERLRDEIDGSRRRIEEETGKPAVHFCYPNGRYEDIGQQVLEKVRAAGFETGVVTAEGLNFPGCDSLLLKRIPADPAYSDLFFQEYLAGVRGR
jgi:peptidoglycan/xylan/chitin deacetylase (PgdA/CDA1 family)